MTDYLYHMTCGCILTSDQLYYNHRKTVPVPPSTLCCLKHWGRIKKKTGVCSKCGENFTVPARSSKKICDKCASHRKKQRIYRKNTERNNLEKHKLNDADPSRWDCLHWDGKCGELAIKMNWKCRPCKNCPDYDPQPLNVDPMGTTMS